MKKLSILMLTASAFMVFAASSGTVVSKNQIPVDHSVLREAGDTNHGNVTAVWTRNSGWVNQGGICISFDCITKSNGFGIFSPITANNENVHMYDKFGNEVTPLPYKMEGYGNGLIINRTKGANYNGYMIKVPKDLNVTSSGAAWQGTNDYNGEILINDTEVYYICNVTDGSEGAWDVLQNPDSITVPDAEKTLNLDTSETYQIVPTITGTTNATTRYSSADTGIATVDDDGTVHAAGSGETIVTVSAGLVKQTVKIKVESGSHTQTGIKITEGKTMKVNTGDEYDLSKVKAVKVYNDQPEGEEITITASMVTGTFDKNTPGDYTLTVTSDTFTDTFTVTVADIPTTKIDNPQKGYNFGNNSPWGSGFYIVTTIPDTAMYVNLGATEIADVNAHIKINGVGNNISGLKNAGGGRYEIWWKAGTTFKPGDVITFDAGLVIYAYSGTMDGNHNPNGDGEFVKSGVLDKEYKFVYTGTDFEVYSAEPSTLDVASTNVVVSIGAQKAIEYTVGPAGTYGLPTFTSSADSTATVTADGKITGVAEGSCTITVKLGTIEKTVNVTVEPAKAIKSVALLGIPNYYSIVKDSNKDEFAPTFGKAKFIYADDSESAEFDLASGSVVVDKTTLDTSKEGSITLPCKVTVDSVEYDSSIDVEVYEYYNQKPNEVAIVDWFNYATFFEFTNTSTNKANFTDGAEIGIQLANISYTRKDGTPVALTGSYQLQSNVVIFPEFLNEVKSGEEVTHAGIDETNYNKEGYYEVGDTLTMLKNTPIYKWTGDIGTSDKPVDGTGERIIEGYTQETYTYKYNGTIWQSFVEYTDMVINTKSIDLDIGKTTSIDVKRVPDNATQGVFSYVSSDPSIATVNDYGVVKGVKAGTCKITVTLKDEDHPEKVKTGEVSVTVKDVVKGIKFDADSYEVNSGTEEAELLKLFKGTYTYASGKEEGAVDFTGAKISGYDKDKEGDQNITVTVTKDGATITAPIKITVKAKGGCGGSVVATSLIISTLALAGAGIGIALKKKRKEDK